MSCASRVVWSLVLPLLLLSAPLRAEPAPLSVRFVYLVSADRPVREDFRAAIEDAARQVQRFYAAELGGPTFALNSPVVEVAHSDQPAAWFYAHDSGAIKDQWGFDNGLAEARRLLGAGQSQDTIWIIYSDGPGNSGRGGGGVAVLPEDDLLGLVGQHPTQKDPRRWVYGLSHELGHALGLGHPPDLEAVPNAIMGAGFYTCFPDHCELTAEDKATLATSRFIRDPAAGPPRVSARYAYDGGVFVRSVTRVGGRARVAWTELAEDRGDRSGGHYTFEELTATEADYLLFDRSRDYRIRIPRAGGRSVISVDGGRRWLPLYPVTLLPEDAR